MIQSSQLSSAAVVLGLVGLLSGLSGCSDDDGTSSRQDSDPATSPTPEDPTSASPTPSTPESSKPGPLVIVTEVKGVDVSQHYLHVLPDWPASGELDYGRAFPLGTPGVTRVEGDAIYFYSGKDGSITRYTVTDDLRVQTGDVLSFSRQGIRDFDPEAIWASPELAFMVDEKTGQIVRFNPRAMEIEETAPIHPEVLERPSMPDLNVQFQHGIARAGRLFTNVNWRDWETNTIYPATVLGVFDQNSPANGPTTFEDERCAPSVAVAPFTFGDGFVYAVGDGTNGYDRLVPPAASRITKPQCVVRMREDGSAFDPDFFVNLQDVTKSEAIYMAYPMEGEKLLVSMWSPEVPVDSVRQPGSADWFWERPEVYEYAIVDLKTRTASKVEGIPRGAVEGQKSLIVDGKNYVQVYRADRGTTVYRVDPDGTVTQVLNNRSAADVQYLGRL